jgi:hypothetical protein
VCVVGGGGEGRGYVGVSGGVSKRGTEQSEKGCMCAETRQACTIRGQ